MADGTSLNFRSVPIDVFEHHVAPGTSVYKARSWDTTVHHIAPSGGRYTATVSELSDMLGKLARIVLMFDADGNRVAMAMTTISP